MEIRFNELEETYKAGYKAGYELALKTFVMDLAVQEDIPNDVRTYILSMLYAQMDYFKKENTVLPFS